MLLKRARVFLLSAVLEETEFPGLAGLAQASDRRFDAPQNIAGRRPWRWSNADRNLLFPLPDAGGRHAFHAVDELERATQTRGKRRAHLKACRSVGVIASSFSARPPA